MIYKIEYKKDGYSKLFDEDNNFIREIPPYQMEAIIQGK